MMKSTVEKEIRILSLFELRTNKVISHEETVSVFSKISGFQEKGKL